MPIGPLVDFVIPVAITRPRNSNSAVLLKARMLHRSTPRGAGVTFSPRPHVLMPSLPLRTAPPLSASVAAPSRPAAPLAKRAGVKQATEKSALAVRRRAAIGQTLVLRASLSLMQSSAISPSTAKEYEYYYKKTEEWELMNLGYTATSETAMDWVLTAMIDDW
jgi:hypothetical protein